jgi:hypothetical protein
MSFRAPSVNHIYQTPLSSSELTKINKNRMLYANYIIKVQDNNVGCDTARTGLESGGVAPGSIIPDLLVGARFTTSAERDRILATSACQFPSPPASTVNPGIGGSMSFDSLYNDVGSQILYPNSASLALGSGDFTIEWFQYLTNNQTFTRPFSIGSYAQNDISIALSYEGNITYFWTDAGAEQVYTTSLSLTTWTHVAIVGTGGTNIAFYLDGTRVFNGSIAYDFTDTTTALAIGNETVQDGNGGAFDGEITNFRWVKGAALYSGATLTVPTQPLTAVSGTQLLLLASTEGTAFVDSSSANRTPTNNGATFSSTNPF